MIKRRIHITFFETMKNGELKHFIYRVKKKKKNTTNEFLFNVIFSGISLLSFAVCSLQFLRAIRKFPICSVSIFLPGQFVLFWSSLLEIMGLLYSPVFLVT